MTTTPSTGGTSSEQDAITAALDPDMDRIVNSAVRAYLEGRLRSTRFGPTDEQRERFVQCVRECVDAGGDPVECVRVSARFLG